MNINEMSFDELETRKSQIALDADQPDADVDALLDEARAINAEIESRKAHEAKQTELRMAVAKGEGVTINETKESEKKMTVDEIRSSKEYTNAFAEYIKTEDDTECRALLTENASGTVPVPTYVEDIVRTAWERDGITSRVRKAYVKGNMKVGFEISSTGATVHTEGGDAVSEETLVLGTVSIVPSNIKKWISISDEVLGLRGEAFLDYIYDELAYQIAKKAADTLLDKIVALSTTATTTAVSVGEVTATAVSAGLIASAMATLSDEASNPTIVMNKATWGAFKAAQAANGYNYDPFEGLDVVFNNHLPAIATASTGDTYVIVGDFDRGALFNFPDGGDMKFVFDDITLATSDLVKVIGRQYVGMGVVAPMAFCKIKK